MSKYPAIIVALVLVLGTQVSVAQTSSSFGGHVESSIVAPTGWNEEYDYQTLSTELSLTVERSAPLGALRGEVFFNADDLNGTGDQAEKLSIRPGEIYLTLFLGPMDLAIGRQTVAWGSVDALSPVDIVNPTDLSDPTNLARTDTDDIRIPVNAVRASLYPADTLKLEALVLPVFTVPGIPDLSAYLPPDFSAVTVAIDPPAPELASFEAGGRATFYLPGVDLALSYLYTWDDMPDIDSVGILQQDLGGGILFGIPQSINLAHNRLHMVGADFAWPLGGVDLRGDIAYYLTADPDGTDIFIKNPFLQYTLQAGYEFFGSLQTNLLFSQKLISNFKKVSDYDYSVDPTDPASLNQPDAYYEEAYAANVSPLISNQRGAVMSSVMVTLQQSFLDYLEASLIGVYNFPHDYDDRSADTPFGDFMVKPTVAYSLTDAFDVSAGANLFFSIVEDSTGDISSDRYTTFGVIDDEDSFFLDVRYSF